MAQANSYEIDDTNVVSYYGLNPVSVVTGLCSLTACSLYAHRITSEFFDPMFVAQKYVHNMIMVILAIGMSD